MRPNDAAAALRWYAGDQSTLESALYNAFASPSLDQLPHLLYLTLFHPHRSTKLHPLFSSALLSCQHKLPSPNSATDEYTGVETVSSLYSVPSKLKCKHVLDRTVHQPPNDLKSLTPATESALFEHLLYLIESNISQFEPEGLVPFLLFSQRLLCTGLVGTSVPFLPDLACCRSISTTINGMDGNSTIPFQSFHIAAMISWMNEEYVFDTPQPPLGSLAAINIPHLPYRFSFSSTTTPATAGSRQHSFQREIPTSVAGPRPSSNARRYSLALDKKYGETGTAPSSAPSSPYLTAKRAGLEAADGRNSITASPALHVSPSVLPNNTAAELKPAKLTGRHEVTRFAMRMLLNILHFLLIKQAKELGRLADGSIEEVGKEIRKLLDITVPAYLLHTNNPSFVRALSGDAIRSAADVGQDSGDTLPAEITNKCRENFGIDPSSSERAYRVIASYETGDTQVFSQMPADINKKLVGLAMTLKSLEMLYLRACYESAWEISIGARCILAGRFPTNIPV